MQPTIRKKVKLISSKWQNQQSKLSSWKNPHRAIVVVVVIVCVISVPLVFEVFFIVTAKFHQRTVLPLKPPIFVAACQLSDVIHIA